MIFRFFIIFSFLFFVAFAKKPQMMLLNEYVDQNITGWLMSEKLDGVRAFWDGKRLLSRNGNEFAAPIWFTKNFPPFAVDGELWSKRGDFENIVSIVSQKNPHEGWQNIRFYIFDVPFESGGLEERLEKIQSYLEKNPKTSIVVLDQIKILNKNHLQDFYKDIVNNGGEGVVVRDSSKNYSFKRDLYSLKLKEFQDNECEVVNINLGKGKYSSVMGSIKCKLENGTVFKIGSGFSDQMRFNSLMVGDIITFKHQGLTKYGKPRFPVFLRVKLDAKM